MYTHRRAAAPWERECCAREGAMADLYPIPLEVLVRTLKRDLERGAGVYMLPRKSWWTPDPDRDVSVTHLGQRMATAVRSEADAKLWAPPLGKLGPPGRGGM